MSVEHQDCTYCDKCGRVLRHCVCVPDLLPCPYCGSETEPKWTDDRNDTGASSAGGIIVCDASSGTDGDNKPFFHHGCGASTGHHLTEKTAALSWNKRPDPSGKPVETEIKGLA